MSNWRNKAIDSGRAYDRPDVDTGRHRKKKKIVKHPCKALECLLCTLRFSIDDILSGAYNIETFICSLCYAEMQQKPHEQNCFGKPTFILTSGKHALGYEPIAKECQDVCPDRMICKRIVYPNL